MQITAGTRLGPYEVVSLLGAGGMGEVFKARDTRLDRSVAIKVLPAEFANDTQLRLRFEREAKTISQINHPNICTLHDIGNDNGVDYLVMELLEGESLADRLARGPLPLRDVLRYGIEIASALDKAHHAGVVHRDLKPGNIVITKTGAKLLDFGLAKAANSFTTSTSESKLTEAKPLTEKGTIVGTFQYMSPEQLEGCEADARSDIFALGAVLYEMATGRRAFEGKTKTSLIAAIVSSEPKPISAIQPLTPPAFEQVVRGCLAKEIDDRIQTAHDVVLQLRWINETISQTGAAAPHARRRDRRTFLWPVALVAAAVLATYGGMRWQKAHTVSRVYRATLQTPDGSVLGFRAGPMALSPDGSQIVYSGMSSNGGSVLLVRKLTETTWRTLSGTSGARSPFWSPDGTHVGYLMGQKMMKISADGSGAPEEIADVSDYARPAWSGGTIIYTRGEKLFRVSSSGGKGTELRPIVKNGSIFGTQVLPDARHVLFSFTPNGQMGSGNIDTTEVVVAAIEGNEPAKVLGQGGSGAYANGYLFFMRGGMLYAQKFDAGKLQLEGEPKAIAKVQDFGDGAFFSVTDEVLVYLPEGSQVRTELQRVERSGKRIATIGQPAFFFSPRLSHDGSRIATDVSATNGFGDIWIYDAGGNTATRFTFAPENESAPVWSPDDSEIAYMFEPTNAIVTMRKHLAGGGSSLVADEPGVVYATDWSPDGKHLLAVTEARVGEQMDIAFYSLPRSKPIPLANSPAMESSPRFSPDGASVAYTSNESGRDEIYVQPFPPDGNKWQITVDGGYAPVWSRNGRSLFFINAAGMLSETAVTRNTDGSTSAQPPQPLFPVRLSEGTRIWAQYDLAPDGTFLLNAVPDSAATPMTMIINWKSLLER